MPSTTDNNQTDPPQSPSETPALSAPRWPLVWQTILLAYAAAAVFWWGIMPGGFPLMHARFWANCVLPSAVVVAAAVGLVAAWSSKWNILHRVAVAVPAAWMGAAAGATIAFPVSARRFLPLALPAIVFFLAVYLISFYGRRCRCGANLCVVVLAAIVGGLIPLTQRAPTPDTHPIDAAMPEVPITESGPLDARVVDLSDRMSVRPSDGTVLTRCGDLRIEVQPMLTFQSRSPDRCWTIFAPRRHRIGPPRRLKAVAAEDATARLRYEDDAIHALSVTSADDGTVNLIESYTQLDRPVFSHLNAYCQLTISGQERLALSFSPCADTPVEVLPSDYPVGRPARLAYMGAEGTFRVVEARSGEKGPFRTLAQGKLARGEPLTITLHADGRAVCEITLDDWSAQAATSLSPTAGWGLPQGAIEFSRLGDLAKSPAAVWITLAATSVGRGWDSVGHAAGTYRNRMRIAPTGR